MTDPLPQDLAALARSGDHDRLDEAWLAAMERPPRPGPLREALEVLLEKGEKSRAMDLGMSMAGSLEKAGRHADACTLLGPLVRFHVQSRSLSAMILRCLESSHGGEEWFPVFRSRAGLGEEEVLDAAAFERFERLMGLLPGKAVYHRNGWNEGVVERLDLGRQELVVRFASGRVVEMPVDTAEESLTPLDEDDPRAMRLQAPERLRELCVSDASRVLRLAARVHRGKTTAPQLKDLLCGAVLDPAGWNAFWKRAKAAAVADPLLRIEGSRTRPVFVLRGRPLALEEEARAAAGRAGDMASAVAVLRGFLGRATDEQSRSTLLDVAAGLLREQRLLGAGGQASGAPLQALEVLVLLEEHGRQGPIPVREALLSLARADAEQGKPMALLSRLLGRESRAAAVRLLPEILGEGWVQAVQEGFLDVPDELKEDVVEALRRAGHLSCLAPWLEAVAPFPHRHAVATWLLLRLHAEDAFEGAASAPTPEMVLRVSLQFCRRLGRDRRTGQAAARLLNRMVTLLAGRKRPLLPKLLAAADRDALAGAVVLVNRAGSDLPEELSALVVAEARARHPELIQRPEVPFWEEELIFTTRKGLERRREEFRRLRDVKIPQNASAIGAAAAHGDLSENSEWDAAIEEQRNLTAKATAMEAELRKARLLEEVDIPGDVVAPGTRVTYTDQADGTQRARDLLGPWDVLEESEDVISYLAPLAKGLLGRRPGDTATIQVPGGQHTVRIEKIEPLFGPGHEDED